jgi:hypothetical protein
MGGIRATIGGLAAALVTLVTLGSPSAAHAFPTASAASPTAIEGNGATQATVTFTRSGVLLDAVRLHVQTADVTARAGMDYVPYEGFVTMPALASGSQSVSVSFTLIGDLFPEPSEYFAVVADAPAYTPFEQIINGVPATSPRLTSLVTIADTPDAPPPAGRQARDQLISSQILLSQTPSGGVPNAPAAQPVISWDARTARYAAYTSAATNIAPDSGSFHNVYLVTRGGVPGRFGTPWQYGHTKLASPGRGGAPANGDSWSPALSRWTRIDEPRGAACLAFVSRASNLVRGDTNNRADVFVRRLPGGHLRRIASPRGRAASAVTIAGDCKSVAMTSSAALYVARVRGGKPHRIARGAIASPHLTFNGGSISYANHGTIYHQRVDGRPRNVGRGSAPTSDGGRVGIHPKGAIRAIAYARGGVVYQRTIGGGERRISSGSAPSMTAGAAQTMFASGPYLYMYATSNHFGEILPQGLCPPGHGTIGETSTSARGNYIAFTCSSGALYLAYAGPK